MKTAQQMYDQIVNMLKTRDWRFSEHPEDLLITFGLKGEDLPMDFFVQVKEKQSVVMILSWLPFEVPEDKRLDMALGVCVANHGMVQGSFDFDTSTGRIMFRITTGFEGSELSDDLLENLIFIAGSTVDNYNDRFFMLSKGVIDIDKFIELDKQ